MALKQSKNTLWRTRLRG